MSKDKVKPKTEQQLAQDFLKEYEVLCKKHGHRVMPSPSFQRRDDGTYSIVIQTVVGKSGS